MRVVILGGDGYLGWPTALYFKARGDDVHLIDNGYKRAAEEHEGIRPLVEVADFGKRCYYAEVEHTRFNILEYRTLRAVLKTINPNVIIHYAEQPSAPFSMKSIYNCANTQHNNVLGTLSVLWVMKDICPNAHLIKLGTMGEYGTPDCDIPEGYIEEGEMEGLPFPKDPKSFYHLSKVHDSHNIMFACKEWGLRATDLNQGVVYGVETAETKVDPIFETSFHYDSIFGTVLNRFCTQAVVGHSLTVYGGGLQRRTFLNINDTMQCVRLAAENPPEPGRMRVFNQFTEIFSIKELAELVKTNGEKVLGKPVDIDFIDNPRNEAEGHHYNPSNKGLMDLGLNPTKLSDTVLNELIGYISRNHSNIDKKSIMPEITWK